MTLDGKFASFTQGNVNKIELRAHTNQVELEKLSTLSPVIKRYGLNGRAGIEVAAQGELDQLSYGAEVKLNKINFLHEAMKQPITIDGVAAVAANQLKKLRVKLTAKDFDLTINGNAQDLVKPRFKFAVNANEMNLDGLLKSLSEAAQKRKPSAEVTSNHSAARNDLAISSTSKTGDNDHNAFFSQLRDNPLFAASAGEIDFDLKKITAVGIKINDTKGKLALSNLVMSLQDFSMKIFGGAIDGAISVDAKPAKPECILKAKLAGLDSKQMAASQMPLARDTIKGLLHGDVRLAGSGLNSQEITAHWKGNGHLSIKDAVLSTVDIGRQLRDDALGKLPSFARSKVKIPESLVNGKSEYENLLVKFDLNGGVLALTEISGKAYPNRGLDLNGNGQIKLANYDLDLALDVIDTYNLTGGDAIAKDPKYGHFALSPKASGTLLKPKFDWGSSASKLAQNAAKQHGAETVQRALGGQKPQEAVKQGLKKLFGR